MRIVPALILATSLPLSACISVQAPPGPSDAQVAAAAAVVMMAGQAAVDAAEAEGVAMEASRAPLGARARVVLSGADPSVTGTAALRQGSTGVVMRIEMNGLTPGWHGLHIHAVGQCEGPGYTSAGSHIQHDHGGSAVPHGLMNAEGPDAGDLPNLYVDEHGHGMAEIFTPYARLADVGPGVSLLDADGSALVIHANPDDHASQPIGGAGARVACGVITAE